MLFREVLRNKLEECSADVSLDVFTESRVVPYTLFFCKNIVFQTQAGYYYFFAYLRLKIFLNFRSTEYAPAYDISYFIV